jgi:hypothetical protein
VRDVRRCGLCIAHPDGRIARGGLPARASGIAEDALRELGKVGEILVDERVALAAEAGEAILDVGRVARLAHLAVVDDVDARGHLLLHDLLDRRRDARVERRHVDRDALLAREHRADEIFRPGQAARVGGQESLGASLHDVFPLDVWRAYDRPASPPRLVSRAPFSVRPFAPRRKEPS